jgi:hypothetical protein
VPTWDNAIARMGQEVFLGLNIISVIYKHCNTYAKHGISIRFVVGGSYIVIWWSCSNCLLINTYVVWLPLYTVLAYL